MILKTCTRCKKLFTYHERSYCDECKPIIEAARKARQEEKLKAKKINYNRAYNARRDPKYTRFYNSKDWIILSRKYTQDKGYKCESCGVIASQVHHKKPIQTDVGWNLRLCYENLELLCTSCHNKRHDRFKSFQSKKEKEKNPNLVGNDGVVPATGGG